MVVETGILEEISRVIAEHLGKPGSLTTLAALTIALAACTSALPTATVPSQTARPTETPTPTNTPTPTTTPTITPTPIHPSGRVIFHEANDTIPYHWFTYVPTSISKDEPAYILLTGIRAGFDTYDALTEIAGGEIQWRTQIAEENRYILLVPHIPRRRTPHIYAAAFDRQVFLHSTDAFYQRPDIKVNLMIDTLISQLRTDGYDVQEQVFLEGFSVGGMFAQRYALLHPERVKAIAAGHCGGVITLPESHYNGTPIIWPIGINDFAPLVGDEFRRDTYEEVPQFIYIGEQDLGPTNSTEIVLGGSNSTLWDMGWDSETARSWIVFLDNAFGATHPVKLENQARYLLTLGYGNITFTVYPGVGHQQTEQMMDDTMMFFDAQRQGGPSAQYGGIVVQPSPTPGPAPTLPIVIDGNAQNWSAMTPVLEDEEGDSLAGEDMDLTAMYLAQDANYVFLMLRTAAALTEEQAEVDLWLDLLPGSHCDQSEVGLAFHPDDTVGAWDSTVCGRINPLGIVGALVRWGDVLEARIPRASLGEHEHIIPVTVRLNTPFNGEWNSADVIP